MDLTSKYRLIGAAVWLGVLVLVVPKWYSEPVNFVPDGEVSTEVKSTLPLVDHAYRLPSSEDKPKTDIQSQKEAVLPRSVSKESSNLDVSDSAVHTIQYPDIVSGNDKYSGQWIVRIRALDTALEANALAKSIDDNYQVYIKFFVKTQKYSVRTGPYISEAKAKKDRVKLDKMLHTKSEVVQLP